MQRKNIQVPFKIDAITQKWLDKVERVSNHKHKVGEDKELQEKWREQRNAYDNDKIRVLT